MESVRRIVAACWGWETLHDGGGLRVQRRGWRVRVRRIQGRGVDCDMDVMTRRLHGWYGRTLAAVLPDYTRSLLVVGMDCAALPAWVAEWLPSCRRVVAVDVVPLLRHLARRYLQVGDAVVEYANGTLQGYVRDRVRRGERYDAVLLDKPIMDADALADATDDLSCLLTTTGRLIVHLRDTRDMVATVEHLRTDFARVLVLSRRRRGCVLVATGRGRLSTAPSPSRPMLRGRR